MLTLPQFEKKFDQKFQAMRNTDFHEPYSKHRLEKVNEAGWEKIWYCTNTGCYLHVSE